MACGLLLTSSMLLTNLALAVLLGLPAATSVDRPSPKPAPVNHFALNLGAGSSVGALGFTYDRDLGPRWQLQAGLGVGDSGWQVSVMPRRLLRFGPRHALFAGAGPSLAIPINRHWTRPPVLWANAEGGYQYERSRFFLQLGLGASVVLWGKVRPPFCFKCDVEYLGPGTVLPGLRFAVGFRF
jgi:hypothetical protein